MKGKMAMVGGAGQSSHKQNNASHQKIDRTAHSKSIFAAEKVDYLNSEQK